MLLSGLVGTVTQVVQNPSSVWCLVSCSKEMWVAPCRPTVKVRSLLPESSYFVVAVMWHAHCWLRGWLVGHLVVTTVVKQCLAITCAPAVLNYSVVRRRHG